MLIRVHYFWFEQVIFTKWQKEKRKNLKKYYHIRQSPTNLIIKKLNKYRREVHQHNKSLAFGYQYCMHIHHCEHRVVWKHKWQVFPVLSQIWWDNCVFIQVECDRMLVFSETICSERVCKPQRKGRGGRNRVEGRGRRQSSRGGALLEIGG